VCFQRSTKRFRVSYKETMVRVGEKRLKNSFVCFAGFLFFCFAVCVTYTPFLRFPGCAEKGGKAKRDMERKDT
jgi:hypothetical protein